MLRNLDKLGRVVLPKRILQEMELHPYDPLRLEYDPEQKVITLKKFETTEFLKDLNNKLDRVTDLHGRQLTKQEQETLQAMKDIVDKLQS